jgi:hypothetical protein
MLKEHLRVRSDHITGRLPVCDAIGHAMERCPHELDELVRVPRRVAISLLHNKTRIICDWITAAMTSF